VERLYRRPRFAIEWKNHFLKLISAFRTFKTKVAMQASGESSSIQRVFGFSVFAVVRDLNFIFERGAFS
jgi:hypothetical protein